MLARVQLKNRSLTPLQGVAVVFGLLVAATLVWLIWRGSTALWHRKKVRGMIPTYLADLRRQRDVLSDSIEQYRAHFGYYPPNHSSNRVERALLNPLYYELVGTRW